MGFAAVAIVVVRAQAQCPLVSLDPPDVRAHQFGHSVAVSGDTVLVGVPQDGLPFDRPGAAAAFRRVGANWVFEARLVAPDGMHGDNLGTAVALDGDVAVAGARGHQILGLNDGAAYLFRREGTAWVQEAKLTSGDLSVGANLGAAVSISGDTVAVGAPFDSERGILAGAAYVFRHGPSGWLQEAKLTASDASDVTFFGSSVAVSGDTVVVGAHAAGLYTGAAYVFRRGTSGWVEEAKLLPTDAQVGMRFGEAVAIDGDTAAMGANAGNILGGDRQAAYIFGWDGVAWNEEAKLSPGSASPGSLFGAAVSLRCDLLLVGAPFDTFAGSYVGSVFFFRRTRSGWVEEAKLTSCMPMDEDTFGFSVGLDEDHAVVGALRDDRFRLDAGAAFVLDVETSCACTTCDDLAATIESAEIKPEGVRRSLLAKQEAACRAFERGQVLTASNILLALVHECDAQAGHHVDELSADDIRACVTGVAEALDIPVDLRRGGRSLDLTRGQARPVPRMRQPER
jgi:hypothetical protein